APADQGGSTAPEGERIAKVLSRAGIASRREAERMIELGEVAVNGKVITSPALNVTATDRITVRGEPVGTPEPARLWLYYKPEGLVTSASDEKGRDTVFDHLPEDMPRVMSVGRLDLNSEGLLLLTNDGGLKRRLELPSTGWLRKYRVRVKGNPTEPEIEPLRKGITIDGERFQAMEVKIDRHQGANAWLTIGIREGKNREIRRAMTHIGLTVNRLIRVSYGPFRLNELQPGEVEELKPRVLREQLGLAEAAAEPEVKKPLRRVRPGATATADATAPKSARPRRTDPPGASPAKGTARPKPGDGLKSLSETWQKATRRPAAPKDGAIPDRPARTPREGATATRNTPRRPTPTRKG
ncbi:MAG: RNA pseudouridine synthase, partial [Rhodobacterales bacterium 17-64-5]